MAFKEFEEYKDEVTGGDGNQWMRLIDRDNNVILDGVRAERDYTPEVEGTDLDANLMNSLQKVFPVGSIYMSVNGVNPRVYFGGYWERFANGKVLMGVNESDVDFNTANKSGGTKYVNESVRLAPNQYSLSGAQYMSGAFAQRLVVAKDGVSNTGSGLATFEQASERNALQLPPYITCYMWVRRA